MKVTVSPQLWWYVARASGIVAWALATAAVLWGISLSSRVLGKRPKGPWLLDLHKYLGALTVVFTGVHLAALVADSFTHWGPTDLLVPFASSWNPIATAWGVVAMYLLIAVEGTSLMMKRIPKKFWRAVHSTSFGLYVVGTVHLLTAGTDRGNPVLLGTVILSILAVVFGSAYRVVTAGGRARVADRIPRRPTPAAATAAPAAAAASTPSEAAA